MAYENQSNAVGFLGLDEISLDLAASLLRSGYAVQAFEEGINDRVSDSSDQYPQLRMNSVLDVVELKSGSLIDEFSKIGGKRCRNAVEMNEGLAAIVLLIPQGVNLFNIIVDNEAIIKGLHKDAVIILHSTLSYIEIHKLEKILTDDYQLESIVDIFVMRTPNYILDRELMIVSSGKSETIRKAQPILSAICRKQYSFVGELGAGSKTDMVIKLLGTIHFIAAIEAISLGAQSGVHPLVLYDIISNAAGNSWYFKNHLPELLRGDQIDSNFISTLTQNSVAILDIAKSLVFPLPLLTIAHQQLIAGYSHGKKEDDVVTSFKLWEKMYGVNVADAVKAKTYNPEEKTHQISLKSRNVKRIGFIGLGAMGFGMATHLLKSNFSVIAYDVYQPSLSRFEIAGGMIGTSPSEVSKDADVLILMVANEVQAESALYGPNGAVSSLPSGASVVVSSTVSPTFIRQLKQRLEDDKKNLTLVDAPVSGGVKRASDGTLTIMAAGTDDALMHACSVLSALSEKLYIIEGGCGAGSGVKMVNQLLAGVHIASAAEAMAFGAHLGLNTRLLFDVITCSSGTSWMFENRAPHMVENDYTPLSAVNIFVKDLGIVSHEGSSLQTPLYVSTIAYQLFLAGSAAGWGRLDDAAVVKVYETLTGVKVKAELPVLSKESVLKSLPPEWPTDPVENIQKLLENNSKTLIVLDDDPTGTQTVHDIEVLTEWDVESLVEQFKKEPRCFFILTNSRALSSEKATKLITTICTNIKTAAKSVKDVDYTVVLRGDSTLRGHFPEEADAAVSVLGEMDSWIICPFFLEGGRYTIGDIHYVADSDRLVPAGETEFAKDAAFGYNSSNLCDWVEEKTRGRISAFTVATISIDLLRKGGPDAVCKHLCGLQKGSTCIVNAASERDMAVFAAGMIQAEQKGKRFLCRTAASFVSARVGIIKKAPTSPEELGILRQRNGGLIVVGSYVPKTTKQVEELRLQCGHFLESIEIPVERVAMKSLEERECVINQTVEMADALLRRSKDTLIVTSRKLIKGENAAASLEINFKVSSALVEIVKRISTRPRYILAKGGITSSDLATMALGARRAKVVGQALAGVPLWLLGPESKHPDVPYIVFPGNVGDANALAEVVTRWARPSRISTTKELLLNAEKGGYAVGAFNVYNLEGAEAVVAAAEHEKSPAILQIHPGAFKHGGVPLVMCCISAAEQSNVPITVHFDHGNSKQELMEAIHMGFDSVMVDGSHLRFSDNVSYTKCIVEVAHSKNMLVEAELGRLSGTEDGLTVEDYEALLTDVSQANEFIDTTGIDALAVCIGNVHGNYPPGGPNLKLDLLKKLYDLTSKKGVHLVLHGASGLQKDLVEECIKLGIRKINVNTEVRKAYVDALITSSPKKELIDCITSAKEAMKAVVAQKMRLFGSSGKA